jgi:hypothetical protein
MNIDTLYVMNPIDSIRVRCSSGVIETDWKLYEDGLFTYRSPEVVAIKK